LVIKLLYVMVNLQHFMRFSDGLLLRFLGQWQFVIANHAPSREIA
jgi:hypothetical protein